MVWLPFNVLMLLVDAVAVVWIWRRERPPADNDATGLTATGDALVLAAAMAIVSVGGFALAAALSDNAFWMLGLYSWAVFIHAPAVLLLAAWRLRPRPGVLVPAWASWGAAVTALGLIVFGVYAFVVEPRRLEVSHHKLAAGHLTAPLRVAVLADIQTDSVGMHERRAIRAAVDARPDIVLLPGDYIQDDDPAGRTESLAALRAVFVEEGVEAPMGLHAVRGNVDGPGWTELFRDSGAEVYTTTRSVVMPSPGGDVRVTGLSFEDSFWTDLQVARADEPLHIVLGHGPDFALGEIEADLLVAGHTHGGQVQLPFFGPLITLSRVPRSWASGVTRIDAETTLVVSRGIGMERGKAPRLRFGARPEVVILDVVPSVVGAP